VKLVFDVVGVGIRLEQDNYFGRFCKKRINHKDFQLSTELNLKKKVILVRY
jgi:hypothetical protein